MRLARYLSERIDATAIEEDKQLTLWSYESMKSSAFEGIMLSDLEYGVRTFHDSLRKILPVMCKEKEPLKGTIFNANYSSQNSSKKEK